MKWLIKRFFKPFAKAMLEVVVGALAETVIFAVQQVAKVENLTDEEKRKQAFELIKHFAKQKGINVRDSAINLAIELAVQLLK